MNIPRLYAALSAMFLACGIALLAIADGRAGYVTAGLAAGVASLAAALVSLLAFATRTGGTR